VTYERERLPDAQSYFEAEGLRLRGPRNAKWKTTECRFHEGSDSMRVNITSGAFKCMNCGVGGGDVLAYHMQAHGLEFVEAAKALGAWVEDGKPVVHRRPTPLTPRQALEVMAVECNLVAIAAGNVAHGVTLSQADLIRLLTASNRVTRLVEMFA
jgi:hypothetical protein